MRLENVSRLPTGLLLAEDTVPYSLGTRPRFVLDRIERGGSRELSYPLRSDLRGKFAIGPLEVRVADAFGLVELGRSFASPSTLVVTPPVVTAAAPRSCRAAGWATATAGPGPRPRPGRTTSCPAPTGTATSCAGCTGAPRRGTAS